MLKHYFLFIILFFTFTFSYAQDNAQTNELINFDKTELSKKISNTKIPWIKNSGQQNPDIAFYANTFSGTINITHSGEILYSIPADSTNTRTLKESFITTTPSENREIKGEKQSQTTVNYFIGNDPKKWQSSLSTYQTVNMGELWQDIELKLNAYGNNIEKLFYVKPGADPKNIEINLEGAKKIKIEEGQLIAETGSQSNITFTKPIAWQIIDGKRQEVFVSYKISSTNTYGFLIEYYNPDFELVIDPLIASTYIGGGGDGVAYDMVADATGNVYIAGYSIDGGYPVTGVAYDITYNGSADIIVSKLSFDLSELLASTFIGGSAGDTAFAIALDTDGNVFISGTTNSSDFPVDASSYDNSHNGKSDVFVAKFNADLSTLLSSTLLGGTDEDNATSIAIDANNNIFIAGYSSSDDFPATSGAYDESSSGGIDIILVKFSNDLGTLSAATFAGGTGNDYAKDILIGANGDIYLTGHSTSADYPATIGAYDESFNGSIDVVVSKFNNELSTLEASTYIGGSNADYAYSIAIDANSNIFVAGENSGGTFPMAGTSYDDNHNGDVDVIIAKLNANLDILLASTYIGAALHEQANTIDITSEGYVVVSGETTSENFPIEGTSYDNSINNHETEFSGASDIFVCKLNNNLELMLSSTFIGGENSDFSYALTIDSWDNIFLSGYTLSENYPVTGSAYDNSIINALGKWGYHSRHIYISKLNNNLSSLSASSFMDNSNGQDISEAITIDSQGNIFITGYTGSATLPTEQAYDNTFNGNKEVFVCKFSNDLSQLLVSTFIGGTNDEIAYDITIDDLDNIYIIGDTESNDFPINEQSFDDSFNGGTIDAFLLKMNNDLNSLLASTFIGGEDNENVRTIKINKDNNIVIAGSTGSRDFPMAGSSYLSLCPGGHTGFIAILNINLNSLISST
ncbi:MAG: hypothetical protein DRJ10_14860, partial [Bacteroidetes bacterium]